jgi:glycoprotein endo-alpha-1,2-mannosidase
MRLYSSLVTILLALGPVLSAAEGTEAKPSNRVIAFYYGWYENPATDGHYANWNHPVLPLPGHNSPKQFPGGEDIGSDFYPEGGCYSSTDPATLDRQMRELRAARVGVICSSWWGKDHRTNKILPALFDAAARNGIKICFHIEPFGGRNARTTREAMIYLIDQYGQNPSFYRGKEFGGRPVFFLYDSYKTPAEEWSEILKPGGSESIRGTKYDSAVIGLWVKEKDGQFMTTGHFDGFYTYFAADRFTSGSTTANWPRLASFARQHSMIFIPSVGPGYIDTRIRPWNGGTTRDRAHGAYYDRMFKAALDSLAPLISITSYNEWHEGTQIEPAVPKQIDSFTYLNYLPASPDFYLQRTAHWVSEFEKRQKSGW